MFDRFNDIDLILLAAGSSSRLGKAKQLLPYKNTTLIGHAVEIAAAAGCHQVVVVTGARHEEIAPHIDSEKIKIIQNTEWAEGMASSIRAGLTAIEKTQTRKIAGILIMLCDQPMITSQHLITLCDAFIATNCTSPVATGYADITGVPAVFPASMFDSLQNLQGEQGARTLLNQHGKAITVIPFDSASIDVDTQEDYERLLNQLPDQR